MTKRPSPPTPPTLDDAAADLLYAVETTMYSLKAWAELHPEAIYPLRIAEPLEVAVTTFRNARRAAVADEE